MECTEIAYIPFGGHLEHVIKGEVTERQVSSPSLLSFRWRDTDLDPLYSQRNDLPEFRSR